MSDRFTPETDAELNLYFRHGEAHQVSVAWIEFARKLERERDEARQLLRLASIEANFELCDSVAVALTAMRRAFISQIDNMFAEVREQRDEAREKVKELIYIADRAIDLAEIDFENDKFGVVSELRDGLEKIKQALLERNKLYKIAEQAIEDLAWFNETNSQRLRTELEQLKEEAK
jgi:translation initiation factor 2 alpha subunit (eIF-2alpha)